MKVLVTGGSGFIGSHVVDALIDYGADVTVYDLGVRPHRDDVKYIEGDIADSEATRKAAQGCRYVFHLAAVSDVNRAFADPLACARANILGTATILDACRYAEVERLIFASTVWVYGAARAAEVHEDSPFYITDTTHIYTSSKISGELLCQDYFKLYGQRFTVLRYGIPYGPRMRDALVIPIFIRKALKGEPLTVLGDGSQYRNFVYIRDLADAHILALDDKAENQIYNLEGPERITIRNVAETIRGLIGDHVTIVNEPARPGDYVGKAVSAEKAANDLGWVPLIGFEEGMRRTLDWIKDQVVNDSSPRIEN